MRVKMFSILFILIADILLLPVLIFLLFTFIDSGKEGITNYLEYIDIPKVWKMIISAFKNEQTRGVWLLLQLMILALIISILWRTKPRLSNSQRGRPKAAGSGEFGTSRFLTNDEIRRIFTPWRVHQSITKGGFVIGYEIDKKTAYLVTEDTHSLVIGATRSGKSRRLILPTIWTLAHAGESMVLTDPKGELYELTQAYLKSKGYNVICLDFRKPGRGSRWNPMYPIIDALDRGDESAAAQAAFNMAHLLVHQNPDSMRGDQVWNNGAESTIAALTLAIAKEAPQKSQKHMASVYKTLMELGEPQMIQMGNTIKEYVPLNEFFRSLPMDHIARDAFGSARLAPDKMRGSFYSQVSTLLRLFSDPSIAYLTAVQDHDIEMIGQEKTAVFLIIPDEDTTRHPLATLYTDQSYQILVDVANSFGGRLPIRVNYLLDEFGNMPPIKDFATKLTVSGGRGIRFQMVLQDFQQLKSKYANDAQTLKGNAHTWIYLLSQDVETAKEISAACGKYTIQTHNQSATFRERDESSGLSVGITGRDLLTPDEVRRWPQNFALVIQARQYPAEFPLPDLSLWPASQDFIRTGGDENRKIQKVPIFIPSPETATKSNESKNDSYMDQII